MDGYTRVLCCELFASLCMFRDAKFQLGVVFMALYISQEGYPINLHTRHY